jgi:hypothetical protein
VGVESAVSELDHLREEVAYLKFWLGVLVVAGVSIAGWLVLSFDTAAGYDVLVALCGLILLAAGIVVLNRRIEHRISRIREL